MDFIKNCLERRVAELLSAHQSHQNLKNSLQEFFKLQKIESGFWQKFISFSLVKHTVFLKVKNKSLAQEISWRRKELLEFLKNKGWKIKNLVVR